MRVYKKLVVGLKAAEDDTPRLSYMLPLDGKKTDETKRKRVAMWSKKFDYNTQTYIDGEVFELDNHPVAGYKIVGFSSRYSTSNKHVYVEHPNGFYFELAIETFIEMIKECTIKNTIIEDEMILYYHNGKNALCSTKSKLYDKLEFVGEKLIPFSQVEVNSEVFLRGVSTFYNRVVYIGKYTIELDTKFKYAKSELEKFLSLNENDMYKYYFDHNNISYDTFIDEVHTSEEKHIFVVLNDKDEIIGIETRKDNIKVIKILSINNIISDTDIVNQLLKTTYKTMREVNTSERQLILKYMTPIFDDKRIRTNQLIYFRSYSVDITGIRLLQK